MGSDRPSLSGRGQPVARRRPPPVGRPHGRAAPAVSPALTHASLGPPLHPASLLPMPFSLPGSPLPPILPVRRASAHTQEDGPQAPSLHSGLRGEHGPSIPLPRAPCLPQGTLGAETQRGCRHRAALHQLTTLHQVT